MGERYVELLDSLKDVVETVTVADGAPGVLPLSAFATLANPANMGNTYTFRQVTAETAPYTVPVITAPAAFTIGMWSVDDAGTDGEALLTVSTLPDNGGATINALQYRIGVGDPVNLPAATTGTYSIAGLTNDAAVNVQLRAGNSAGFGDWSDTKSVTPTGVVTGQPEAFTEEMWDVADTQEGGTLAVTISAYPNEGASEITSVEVSVDGGAWTTLAGSITGLTDDVAAGIRLRAVNAQGAGGPSDTKTRTPTTAAAAVPTAFSGSQWGVQPTGVSGQIRLSVNELPFANPNVTGLEYRLDGGAAVALPSTALTTHDIDGLTNDQAYSAELRALNAEGPGAWSSPQSATPFVALGHVITGSFVDGVLTVDSPDAEGPLQWASTDTDADPGVPAIMAGTGAYDSGTVNVLSGQFTGTLPIPNSPDVNITGPLGLEMNVVMTAPPEDPDRPPSNILRIPFHVAAQSSVLEDDAGQLGWWKATGLVNGTGAEEGTLVEWTDEATFVASVDDPDGIQRGGRHFKRIGTSLDVPFTPGYVDIGAGRGLRTEINGYARAAYLAGTGFATIIVGQRVGSTADWGSDSIIWAENVDQNGNNLWSVTLDPRNNGVGRALMGSRAFANAHAVTIGLEPGIPAAEYQNFILIAVFHPGTTPRGLLNFNGRHTAENTGTLDTADIPQASYRMSLGGRISNSGAQGGIQPYVLRYREVYATTNIAGAHLEAVAQELANKFSFTWGA